MSYRTTTPRSKVTIEWGLQAENGYIRWCVSKIEAEGMKSGRLINGRVGDWRDHTLVRRIVTTSWSEPEGTP